MPFKGGCAVTIHAAGLAAQLLAKQKYIPEHGWCARHGTQGNAHHRMHCLCNTLNSFPGTAAILHPFASLPAYQPGVALRHPQRCEADPVGLTHGVVLCSAHICLSRRTTTRRLSIPVCLERLSCVT